MRRWLAIVALQCVSGWAHACLFATTTSAEGWLQWSSRLFGGDVTAVEKDLVTVSVADTFKGADAAGGTLSLRISDRYWTNCKVERPAVGARVLVAMNASGEVMLVPLSASYAEQLRQQREKPPRQ